MTTQLYCSYIVGENDYDDPVLIGIYDSMPHLVQSMIDFYGNESDRQYMTEERTLNQHEDDLHRQYWVLDEHDRPHQNPIHP
jgi:hypothetical protein